MKIVDAATFLKLPTGTVYSQYRRYCFDLELKVKAQTLDSDFVRASLIGDIESEGGRDFIEQMDKARNGESVPMVFSGYGRDGSSDLKRFYAIYEKQDLLGLIGALEQAIKEGYSDAEIPS